MLAGSSNWALVVSIESGFDSEIGENKTGPYRGGWPSSDRKNFDHRSICSSLSNRPGIISDATKVGKAGSFDVKIPKIKFSIDERSLIAFYDGGGGPGAPQLLGYAFCGKE